MKHLQFYYNNLCKDEVYLCNEARAGHINIDLLKLFKPTYEEAGDHRHCFYAWGEQWDEGAAGYFNDFRQNVVLLMAAMNGEL